MADRSLISTHPVPSQLNTCHSEVTVTPVDPDASSEPPLSEEPTVEDETPSTDMVPDDRDSSTPMPAIASDRSSPTVPPVAWVHSIDPFPRSRSTSVSPVASDGGTMQTAVASKMATIATDASVLLFIDNPQS